MTCPNARLSKCKITDTSLLICNRSSSDITCREWFLTLLGRVHHSILDKRLFYFLETVDKLTLSKDFGDIGPSGCAPTVIKNRNEVLTPADNERNLVVNSRRCSHKRKRKLVESLHNHSSDTCLLNYKAYLKPLFSKSVIPLNPLMIASCLISSVYPPCSLFLFMFLYRRRK